MIDESVDLVKWESKAPEGILVSFRMARPVTLDRFVALREALEEIGAAAKDWRSLDRELAASIHALSFHLEGIAASLRERDKLAPEIEEELPFVYEIVDEIFGM